MRTLHLKCLEVNGPTVVLPLCLGIYITLIIGSAIDRIQRLRIIW
jgi:hypothetical protein